MNELKQPSSWDPRNLTFLGFGFCLLLVAIAAVMPPDTSRDYWQRLERAASVAQVVSLFAVGFVFAQLRLMTDEQRQLKEALSKKPWFKIGFGTIGDTPDQAPTELTLTPTWRPEEAFSEPIRIQLIAWNVGTSTAQQVHYNIGIPGALRVSQHPVPPHIVGGEVRYESYLPYVHPGSSITAAFAIEIPHCDPGFEFGMMMSITMADTDRSFQRLILKVNSAEPA